ncbi:Transcription factor Adf-1 [Anabarilius grahami]|uniref:Transcription factor Adf-1 n=1 Tax=Anabarilius grahami TaxID=495550 RepID=A0A3N0YPR5_ANAGA|nr:Transcription factor Adf-1 [Anabarilius grahami]
MPRLPRQSLAIPCQSLVMSRLPRQSLTIPRRSLAMPRLPHLPCQSLVKPRLQAPVAAELGPPLNHGPGPPVHQDPTLHGPGPPTLHAPDPPLLCPGPPMPHGPGPPLSCPGLCPVPLHGPGPPSLHQDRLHSTTLLDWPYRSALHDVTKVWTLRKSTSPECAIWDRAIVAVCGHPELYDVSSYFYRDSNKKDLAWKRISEEIGQSEDLCRKRWKSLRDTYLKERRKETEKRSGSAAESAKRWKYSAVLSFLDPFVSPGETSGNMESRDRDEQTTGYDHPDQAEAAGLSETGEPTDFLECSEPGSPPPEPESPMPEPAAASPAQAGPSSAAAAVPTVPPSRRRRRPREESIFEKELLSALRSRPQPPPCSEDEHFLLSLLPSLQKLPPQTKEFVKFQMHKLIYESSTVVLNLETLDPTE